MLTHILRHIFQCELTAYRWLAYFSAISVSICTKLARSILMRDRNILNSGNKCCTYVITGRQGHTVSAEPGGHISCFFIFPVLLAISPDR